MQMLIFGYGMEGVFSYRFLYSLSVYGGWSWNHFEAEQSFAGNDVGFEETGYTFGLRFIYPLDNDYFGILLGAGGLYNHIELENSGGDIIGDTGHTLGYQAEAGLSVFFGENETFRLTPALRYRVLSTNVEVNNIERGLDLNYLSLGLGVAVQF
ncbi:MAG: opacity protein [Owenweeksia sp.]|nr:opacity protein [Owenweeksia sp.]